MKQRVTRDFFFPGKEKERRRLYTLLVCIMSSIMPKRQSGSRISGSSIHSSTCADGQTALLCVFSTRGRTESFTRPHLIYLSFENIRDIGEEKKSFLYSSSSLAQLFQSYTDVVTTKQRPSTSARSNSIMIMPHCLCLYRGGYSTQAVLCLFLVSDQLFLSFSATEGQQKKKKQKQIKI